MLDPIIKHPWSATFFTVALNGALPVAENNGILLFPKNLRIPILAKIHVGFLGVFLKMFECGPKCGPWVIPPRSNLRTSSRGGGGTPSLPGEVWAQRDGNLPIGLAKKSLGFDLQKKRGQYKFTAGILRWLGEHNANGPWTPWRFWDVSFLWGGIPMILCGKLWHGLDVKCGWQIWCSSRTLGIPQITNMNNGENDMSGVPYLKTWAHGVWSKDLSG